MYDEKDQIKDPCKNKTSKRPVIIIKMKYIYYILIDTTQLIFFKTWHDYFYFSF